MKSRIALLGTALVGATLLCGPVLAQSYNSYDGVQYNGTRYSPPTNYAYDAPRPYSYEAPNAYAAPVTETVIVRPDYEYIEKQQLIGNINGEHNPTAYTISRPVTFSDLNLSNPTDRRELRARVHDTAEELCDQLDGRILQLRGDASADRECVRNATRNALRDVLVGGG